MYGFEPDVDLSFLVGKPLFQICLGLHQLQLRFDGEVTISVENVLALKQADGAVPEEWRCAERHVPAGLIQLLNESILSYHASPDGTLRMAFSNGTEVELVDDNPHYECYQISHGTRVVVV